MKHYIYVLTVTASPIWGHSVLQTSLVLTKLGSSTSTISDQVSSTFNHGISKLYKSCNC